MHAAQIREDAQNAATATDEQLLIDAWRAEQLRFLGLTPALAETSAGCVDWHDVGRPSRLDYWTAGGGSVADAETAAALGLVDDPALADNVCFVSRSLNQ